MAMTEEEKKEWGQKMKSIREAKQRGAVPNPSSEPKVETKPKEETVTLSKSALENLQEDMKKLKQDRDLLLATVDRKALAHYYDRNKQDIPSVVKLSLFPVEENGSITKKLIIAWRTVKNEVFQIPGTQRWVEDQVTRLVFSDGTSIDVPYVTFVRGYEFINAKVIGSTIDEITKESSLRVIREDNGEEVVLGVKFVN